MSIASRTATVGDLLRDWRQRRRLSQLDLALEAQVSARHLRFVETGRSQPSRELVIDLAEQLEVPLRERNAMRQAAWRSALAVGSAAARAERHAACRWLRAGLRGNAARYRRDGPGSGGARPAPRWARAAFPRRPARNQRQAAWRSALAAALPTARRGQSPARGSAVSAPSPRISNGGPKPA